MMNIDKIYIVHYEPLIERKKYLLEQFLKYNVTNFEFYTEFDRRTVTQDKIRQYFHLHNLNPAQICITIAHIEIYRDIVKNKYNSCLILEDDALFCDNFAEKFNTYMSCMPADYDMAFLNDGCGFHATSTGDIWCRATFSRTCCSYIITGTACKKMLPTIIPFTKAIDHELNTQITLHKLQVYWCEPTLIHDGSDEKYGSSHVQWCG